MPVAASLRTALSERVVVADGAMGTMLQSYDLGLDDFQGHEGCNEILSVTRPDVVGQIHDAYLEVGADAIITNTFGANFANLGEYNISERIHELSLAAARIARQAADRWSTDEHPRWVLGSVGPGTKLPTLGHTTFAVLRDAYQEQARGMIEGGIDAVLVETAQDLLQCKAAVIGVKRAIADARLSHPDLDLPVIVNVTVETTGTMLLGSEIGAALTALEPLRIDVIGLNCATGPTEMSEHLRYLSRRAPMAIGCMPNAGLPQLTSDGAHYPLTPSELADAHDAFTREFGLALVAAAAARLRSTSGRWWTAYGGGSWRRATSRSRPERRRCISTCRSARTRRICRSASAPTPMAPRLSARRCSPSAGTTAWRSPRGRSATARTCSTSTSTMSGATVPRT